MPISVYRRIFDLVLYKTYAELKAEAKRTYIGLVWWIVEPIIFMLIFYFVFGVLFSRGTDEFVPFLLIGLVLWHWFQSTIMQCSNAITNNRPLIQQVVVPKALFPTVMITSNLIKFSIVALILLAFLITREIYPTWSWLYCLPVLGVFLTLITGVSFVLAAIVPLVPDIRVLIDNGCRALFFLSGIFYDISDLPPRFAHVLGFNPIAVLISAIRNALMHGVVADTRALAAISTIAIMLTAAGLYLLRLNRSAYAKTTI
jgi:lipopolysaccharide transport system permease protein